jgi:hypothetical protein
VSSVFNFAANNDLLKIPLGTDVITRTPSQQLPKEPSGVAIHSSTVRQRMGLLVVSHLIQGSKMTTTPFLKRKQTTCAKNPGQRRSRGTCKASENFCKRPKAALRISSAGAPQGLGPNTQRILERLFKNSFPDCHELHPHAYTVPQRLLKPPQQRQGLVMV